MMETEPKFMSYLVTLKPLYDKWEHMRRNTI